jgi:hypothetical protein
MAGPYEKPIKLVGELGDEGNLFELGPVEGQRVNKPGDAEDD